MQILSVNSSVNEISTTNNNLEVSNKNNIEQKQLIEKQADIIFTPIIQEKTIIEAIEKANQKLMGDSLELNFSIHEKTKQILVKIINKETKEVIKEIPSEKILDMVTSMCEAAGLFVDKKV